MTAWYNEPDPYKAAVLREAIKAGAIAPGDVDERSIIDVRASELAGYTQCHFFAGGGFWSLALRQAGWPDDRPVDTGSCPCPSFSEAGKGSGFDDDRHLWPVWNTIIGERRPPVLFGEQSAAAIGFGWLDLVCGNLEVQGYAVAAAVLGAHSVGAPHRRQRLYFVGERGSEWNSGEYAGDAACGPLGSTDALERVNATAGSVGKRTASSLRGTHSQDAQRRRLPTSSGRKGRTPETRGSSYAGYSSDTDGRQPGNGNLQRGGECGRAVQPDAALSGHHALGATLEGHFGDVRDWRGPGWLDPVTARSAAEAGATRGFWADCDWWYGSDGKYRPIKPELFPLASRYPGRVGLLRLAGDSIVIPQAVAFIRAYLGAREAIEASESR